MSHATRGIKDHRMFEVFERCHAHLLKIGFPAFDAMRGALAIAFASTEDFTIDQAWEAADEIMDPYKNLDHEEPDAD